MIIKFIILGIFTLAYAKDANVLMTEVFAIQLDPLMFNWTFEDSNNQFVYQASLLNAPDLPSWINYIYSEQHHSGFLYGVPPKITETIPLEVVALNKRTYETRIENLDVIISEKLNSARYEVHLKIDNLNVKDMFDVDKMEALKNVFRKELWRDSSFDIYVTFLSSAIELGARKPLNPDEGEGVVIRLGSEFPFSAELLELQEEVRPLWKVPACPRDFKRTSVERFFREAGFALDWCSFRLVDNNNSAMHHTNGNLVMEEQEHHYESNDIWHSISKEDVPRRSYMHELLVSFLVPVIILIILGLLLSFLLCFESEDIDDEDEKYFFNLFHICTDYYYEHYIYKRASQIDDMSPDQINHAETIHRPVENIRTYNRDMTLSPDLCSHSNSPNSTINRGLHCRPSPPPYIRPKYKPDL
ncbi:unnamed protein product [Psylliodes chrysocephalus]|uniref:Epsilon-sarcoglycan n=1 Tax=Psylliodes chrysocephalus TaxID=3402493 RepID=A0A9P0D566_9CUCU|nr:unnamed protein product [Psylliodes chrysocephala]